MKRIIKFRAIVPVNSDDPKSMMYFDLSRIDDCSRLAYADYDAKDLMEFTGLRDKNGKEIYEGDTIRRRGVPNSFVAYAKGKWVLRYDESGVEWSQDLATQFDKHLEIIGNIYENPELIQKA